MHTGVRLFDRDGWDVISQFQPLGRETGVLPGGWRTKMFKDHGEIDLSLWEDRDTSSARPSSPADAAPTPPDRAHSFWGEEVFSQRALKYAIRLLPNLSRAQLEKACWPRSVFNVLSHFFATREKFAETPVLTWHHLGPWDNKHKFGGGHNTHLHSWPHDEFLERVFVRRPFVSERVAGGGVWRPRPGGGARSGWRVRDGLFEGDGLQPGSVKWENGTVAEFRYRAGLRRKRRRVRE